MEAPRRSSRNIRQICYSETKPHHRGCSGINPLLNSVVLKTVFSYLSTKDLKNARRVCHQWYEVSRIQWSRNVILSIDDGVPCANCKGCECGSRRIAYTHGLTQFLEFFGDSRSVPNIYNQGRCMPYSKFRCQSWSFGNHEVNRKPDQVISNFWGNFGSWMTYLEMKPVEITPESVDIFKNVVFRQTPNLQTLICDVYFKGVNTEPIKRKPTHLLKHITIQKNLKRLEMGLRHHCPIEWLEIMATFPNVEEFRPLHISPENMRQIAAALQFVHKADTNAFRPKHLNLSSISHPSQLSDASPDFATSFSELFAKMQLPLTSASVNVAFAQGDLQQFFVSHAKTLKKLELVPSFIGVNANFGATMESLEELTFTSCYPYNLKFLVSTPYLKTLIIENQFATRTLTYTSHRLLNKLTGLTLPTLTRLEFECADNSNLGNGISFLPILHHGLAREKMAKLRDIMPNITKLKIPLHNKSFRAVCENWRDLHELTVLHDGTGMASGLTDEGITGLTPLQMFGEGKHPNITHLKKLRSFCMVRCGTCLTEKSIFNGFLQLPHLNTLRIRMYNISKNAKKRLFLHVPNAQIVPVLRK